MPLEINGVLCKTSEEIAEDYGYCVEHIRRLFLKGKRRQAGGLPGIRRGRRWYAPVSTIEEVLLKDYSVTDSETVNEPNTGESSLDDL